MGKNKCGFLGLLLGGLLLGLTLSGCSSTELEHTSIPLFAAVREAGDSYELFYEPPTGNKVLDYNHVKVVVFEEAFLQNKDAYGAFLEQIAKETTYPRNAYVCVAADVGKLMQVSELMAEDIGEYIEVLLENEAGKEEKHLPTLGRLLDDWSNRRLTFDLPYLVAEKDVIRTDGIYRIEKSEKMYKAASTGENPNESGR